jgi:hypothetical protein
MKKLLLLLLGITVLACGSDDADADVVGSDNFFSNHGGKWFYNDNGDFGTYIGIQKNSGIDGSVIIRRITSCADQQSFLLGEDIGQAGDFCESITRTISLNTADVLSLNVSVLSGDCDNLVSGNDWTYTLTIDGDVLIETYIHENENPQRLILDLYEGEYPCS